MRLLVAAIVVVAIFASPMAGLAQSPRTATLDPGMFAELASGVVQIRTSNCAGAPLGTGTGFLVGDSVVMTARHVVAGACRVQVAIDSQWVAARGWAYWHKSGRSDEIAADVATIRLTRNITGHIFNLRTSSVGRGANLAAIGHPLGNRLSITQGPVIAKGQKQAIPLLAVQILGASGASGSPLVDDAGNVAGILQAGLGRPDFLGRLTSEFFLGIDLPAWWPSARRDLCRTYPDGGLPACTPSSPPTSTSPAPLPPATTTSPTTTTTPPVAPAPTGAVTVAHDWMSVQASGPAVQAISFIADALYYNLEFAAPVQAGTVITARWVSPSGRTTTSNLTFSANSSSAWFSLTRGVYFEPGTWTVSVLYNGNGIAGHQFTVTY